MEKNSVEDAPTASIGLHLVNRADSISELVTVILVGIVRMS